MMSGDVGGCKLRFDIGTIGSIRSSGRSIAGGGRVGSTVESGLDLGSRTSGVNRELVISF